MSLGSTEKLDVRKPINNTKNTICKMYIYSDKCCADSSNVENGGWRKLISKTIIGLPTLSALTFRFA